MERAPLIVSISVSSDDVSREPREEERTWRGVRGQVHTNRTSTRSKSAGLHHVVVQCVLHMCVRCGARSVCACGVCGHLPEEFEGNSAGAGHHEVGDEEEGLLGQGGGQQGDDAGRVVDEVGQHREQRRTDRRHQEHVEEQEHRVGRHRPPLHVRMRVQPSTPVSCAAERERCA